MNKLEHYLQFSITGQLLLLPIEQIELVVLLPKLQTLPDKSPSFCGMLNHHGYPLPVYDLSRLLMDQSIVLNLDTQVLLVKTKQQSLGFIVTDVHELVSINPGRFKAPPNDAKSYVKSLFETEASHSWLLDLQALIDSESLNHKDEVRHE